MYLSQFQSGSDIAISIRRFGTEQCHTLEDEIENMQTLYNVVISWVKRI